jgi:hypothetical protein
LFMFSGQPCMQQQLCLLMFSIMMLLFLCLRGFAISYHQCTSILCLTVGYALLQYDHYHSYAAMCYHNNSIVCIASSGSSIK